jgi:ATP-dependent helicase/nuclease subunit A
MSARLPHRLVRASAGTGKTYRLTLRYLELLLEGASAERILATTFTRKAAGEILERLLLRLAEASRDSDAAARLATEVAYPGVSHSGPVDQGTLRELLERLCGSLHRLQVSTLDAFFHRATALFRHELRLPRFARIASVADPMLEPLRLRALQAALSATSGEDLDTLVELLGRLYRGDAQRSVVRALDLLVLEVYEAYRGARDLAAWSRLEVAGELLEPLVLVDDIDRARGAAASTSEALRRAIQADLEAAARGDWLDFLTGGVAEKILEQPNAPTYRKARVPAPVVSAYRPLLDHAGRVLLGRIADQTTATHHLLAAFEGPFRELRRRAGIVLYSELVERLQVLFAADFREAPEGGEAMLLDLFFRLDGAVHHLLLDELQDTSLEQWQAIAPLVEELLAYGDGSRSVFGVGDPKQSIYGWRGGCAELFGELEARMLAGAGEVEALTASWRSSPSVLAATNLVFGALADNPALSGEAELAAGRRFAAAFDVQVSAHPERPGYVVLATSGEWEGLFAADDPPVSGEAMAEAESMPEDVETQGEIASRPLGHLDYVAHRVRALVDRLHGGSHDDSLATVGVLCLTNRTVRELRGRLEDLGLDASGEGAGPIDDDPAVTAVIAALRLAEHPGATAAAYQVACGPLGPVVGLRDWRRPEEASRRMRRELAESGAANTVARWLRELAGACDERNARRLQQLTELVPALASDGPGPGELARRIEGSLVDEPVPAMVRVMTVHQAKGLEFDIVVLGELERRIGDLANPLLDVMRLAPAGPVAEVHRATNKTIRGLSEQLIAARRQEVERRVLDDLGVLYVALTRARFELHLLIQPRSEKGAGARTFAALLANALRSDDSSAASGSSVLWELGAPLGPAELSRRRREEPGREEPAGEAIAGARVAAADEVQADETAPALAATEVGRAPRRRRPVLIPSELGAPQQVLASDLLSDLLSGLPRGEPAVAALRGRVFHHWLAGIEWLDRGATRPDDAERLRAARVIDPAASETRLRALLAELLRLVEAEPLCSILSRPPAGGPGESLEVWRERAFLVERDGTLIRGVFDRAVVHLHRGVPVAAQLFEWKTEPLGVAGSSEAAESLRSRHRAQLEAYRQALGTMLGLLDTSVDARVVYLSPSSPAGGVPGDSGA